jgi:tetratricopeptide (TPR) repeat protein
VIAQMTPGEIAGLAIGIIGVVLTIYYGVEQRKKPKRALGPKWLEMTRRWLLPSIGGLALLSGIGLWILSPSGIYVERFTVSPDNADQQYHRGEIERNIRNYLFNHGIPVFSQVFAFQPRFGSDQIVTGRISASPDHTKVVIEVNYTEDGKLVGNASIVVPSDMVGQIYSSIPDVVFNSPGFSMRGKLQQEQISRLTQQSPYAFALYYEAKKKAKNQDYIEANDLLQKAIDVFPRFAEAYWAQATLADKEGDKVLAKEKYDKALTVDKDLYRKSILSDQRNPLPSLRAKLVSSSWETLQPGLEFKELTLQEYELQFLLWRADLRDFDVRLAKATDVKGDFASEIRASHGAPFAANGGFFEKDAENRLSPSGLLVVNGKMLSPYSTNPKLSGMLTINRDKVEIITARPTMDSSQYRFAVQAGPRLVEADGSVGIRSDDENRQERTAVCLEGNRNHVIIAMIKGSGLSLYEFAYLLVEKDGGPECAVALNLDGGPSSQASYKSSSGPIDIPGVWRIDNALLFVKRAPK